MKTRTQILVLMYRRHESWAKRSGYEAMDWKDFKASRIANPLSAAFIAAQSQEDK